MLKLPERGRGVEAEPQPWSGASNMLRPVRKPSGQTSPGIRRGGGSFRSRSGIRRVPSDRKTGKKKILLAPSQNYREFNPKARHQRAAAGK